MPKLEQLEKKVVDTQAADAAYDADWDTEAAWGAADAWKQAKRELNEYLKEQDNG